MVVLLYIFFLQNIHSTHIEDCSAAKLPSLIISFNISTCSLYHNSLIASIFRTVRTFKLSIVTSSKSQSLYHPLYQYTSKHISWSHGHSGKFMEAGCPLFRGSRGWKKGILETPLFIYLLQIWNVILIYK